MRRARDFLEAAAEYAARRGAGRAANRPPRHGTIDPAYDWTTFPATRPAVVLDGETVPGKPLAVLGHYRPRPGDRVLLLPAGTTYVIAGPLRPTTAPAGYSLIRKHSAPLSSQVDSVATGETDLPGSILDVDLPNGAGWQARWTLDAENRATTAGLLAVRISVGGVSIGGREAHFKPSNVAAGLRLTVGADADGTITSSTARNPDGTVRFKLRAYRVNGADADFRLYASHTVLSLLTLE